MNNEKCNGTINLCDVAVQVEMEGVSRIEPDRIQAADGYAFRFRRVEKDSDGRVSKTAILSNDAGDMIPATFKCNCIGQGSCGVTIYGNYLICTKGAGCSACRIRIVISAGQNPEP